MESGVRFSFVIPGEFTDEAIDGCVGQWVKVTVEGKTDLGNARVISAERDPDGLRVHVELPHGEPDAIDRALSAGTEHLSITPKSWEKL